MRERTVALIPDCHHPYQDKRAVSGVLRYIAELQPSEVCILGDYLDVKAPSRWSKGSAAEFEAGMEKEAEAGRWTLDGLRAVYDGPVTFLYGNHEARLRAYVWTNAPALAGIVREIDELLHFEKFKVQTRAQPYRIAPGTIAIHGKLLSKHAGMSAFKELERHGHSVVQGHSHRLGVVYQKREKLRFAMECGWLGDAKKMDYTDFPGVENWQQGFGVIRIRGELVSPECVTIHSSGRFAVNDKWYGVAV